MAFVTALGYRKVDGRSAVRCFPFGGRVATRRGRPGGRLGTGLRIKASESTLAHPQVNERRRKRDATVAIERQGGSAAADPDLTDAIEYPSPEGPFCELGRLAQVPHLSDYLSDLETYENPAAGREFINKFFVDNGDAVMRQVVMNASKPRDMTMYLRAGPRERVYYTATEVRAAIVSCGGICPGINTVIREVVEILWYEYGVRSIFGVQNGYRGFYSANWINMNPDIVDQIHKQGGTILGSSRGGFDAQKITDAIETRGINQVYVIGGDGTIRGSSILAREIRKRNLKASIVSIPKTIDNDIPIIDKSFGFETAVEGALRAINAACVEAQSFPNGLGLVKLMGRNSGFIAMHATLSSRDVMEGPGGLLAYVQKRLKERGRCIIVVAEGAGQDIVEDKRDMVRDRSGNRLLSDIGLYLYNELKLHFQHIDEEVSLKYIDPTYMVRAVPANAADNLYSTMLAHMAVHGAFGGFTGFVVGPVNGFHTYIPIADVTNMQNKVDIRDRNWLRLVASTGQSELMSMEMPAEGNGTADFLEART